MNFNIKTLHASLLRSLFVVAVASTALTASSCKNEKGNTATTEASGNDMIAGETSKEWKAVKETSASGDKDPLSKDEKDERLTFFRNGKYTQTSDANVMNGNWTYDATTKALNLVMDGSTQSSSFTVSTMTDKEMKLMGAGGEALTLRRD